MSAPAYTRALPGLFAGYDAVNLVYITILGSAASYGVFFYNASRGNLTALSSLTFLTPMFAAGTGFLLLGETLTPLQARCDPLVWIQPCCPCSPLARRHAKQGNCYWPSSFCCVVGCAAHRSDCHAGSGRLAEQQCEPCWQGRR